MLVSIESYNPQGDRHSPEAIACLIYESAPALFGLMFGPETRAIRSLTALVTRSHNRFSHRHVRVAEIEQSVVGMVVLVPADQLSKAADYRDVFALPQQLWLLLIQRLLLNYLLRHDYPAGSFYIGNIAVAPSYRNRGIGRQLLSYCIAEVGDADLFISVDIDNPRAQKLYESLGFQVIETKTIRLLNQAVGSRILARR